MGKAPGWRSEPTRNISRRTIPLVSNLDKADARLFTGLCTFCWRLGEFWPFIYDLEKEVYKRRGINFASLTHLDTIGLVDFSLLSGFQIPGLPKEGLVRYYGEPINLQFSEAENNSLDLGSIVLTKIGRELAPIAGSEKCDEFMEYTLEEWQKRGYVTSCAWPREKRS